MSGIALPDDRTIAQPSIGFCRNPQCREVSNQEFTFAVEHGWFSCPKCGANKPPMVGLLTLTHLLTPDKQGPILGDSGIRYKIACATKRAYLATATNQEAATDNPAFVNCLGCVEQIRKLNIKQPIGMAIGVESKG